MSCPITRHFDSGPVDTECSKQGISSQCPNPKQVISQKGFIQGIIFLIIHVYMKKLLYSDWLRAVQFKCNTCAKSVTSVTYTKCTNANDTSSFWIMIN